MRKFIMQKTLTSAFLCVALTSFGQKIELERTVIATERNQYGDYIDTIRDLPKRTSQKNVKQDTIKTNPSVFLINYEPQKTVLDTFKSVLLVSKCDVCWVMQINGYVIEKKTALPTCFGEYLTYSYLDAKKQKLPSSWMVRMSKFALIINKK